jgi:hypothetical protein
MSSIAYTIKQYIIVISVYGLRSNNLLVYRAYRSNDELRDGLDTLPTDLWHLTIKVTIQGAEEVSVEYDPEETPMPANSPIIHPVVVLPYLSRFDRLEMLWLDYNGGVFESSAGNVLFLPTSLWMVYAAHCTINFGLFFKYSYWGDEETNRKFTSALVLTKKATIGEILWQKSDGDVDIVAPNRLFPNLLRLTEDNHHFESFFRKTQIICNFTKQDFPHLPHFSMLSIDAANLVLSTIDIQYSMSFGKRPSLVGKMMPPVVPQQQYPSISSFISYLLTGRYHLI